MRKVKPIYLRLRFGIPLVILLNVTVTIDGSILRSKYLMYSLQSIGQAYEDMQTQNQHLLQQITERDDYNIKVTFKFIFVMAAAGFVYSLFLQYCHSTL